MTAALEGILVVSLEQAVAAPFCSARLADSGARVLKIERAEGDFARGYDSVVHGESAYFVWLNRGKESVVADIKQPEDVALLRHILLHADVFIQNLAPGAAERAGLGSAAVRAANERLITCDISGYGDGPLRDRKAYDLLIQCESGLAEVTGAPDAPGRVGVSVADICCGMNAYGGILEALLQRQRTGKGQGIQVSLFDGMADWMTVPLLHQDYGGRAPGRQGIAHPSIAPYGAFVTGDGAHIVLAVQSDREWRALCSQVLDMPELGNDARFTSNGLRVANRGELHAVMGPVLAAYASQDFVARLDQAGIAYGRLNSVADLSGHPQLRRMHVDTPTGAVSMPAHPVIADGQRNPSGPVPALGAHSDAVRHEFHR
jgi:itaconate CoA-transferase